MEESGVGLGRPLEIPERLWRPAKAKNDSNICPGGMRGFPSCSEFYKNSTELSGHALLPQRRAADKTGRQQEQNPKRDQDKSI